MEQPNAEVQTKSAIIGDEIQLKLTGITVNCDKKTYRNSAFGSMRVEVDGDAIFRIPIPQGEFNISTVGNIIETLLQQVTQTTIKVYNENLNDSPTK